MLPHASGPLETWKFLPSVRLACFARFDAPVTPSSLPTTLPKSYAMKALL